MIKFCPGGGSTNIISQKIGLIIEIFENSILDLYLSQKEDKEEI